jgi:hypothetical protein
MEVHKSQPLNSIRSQLNPLHTFTPYFFKISFNIVSRCTVDLLCGFFLYIFRFLRISHLHLCHVLRPSHQGRIKGFVEPRHFSSLRLFGDSKIIVGTAVYSRLPGLTEGEGMHGQLRNTNNPNFVFYTPTAPIARHRLRTVLFSHTSRFTGRLIVEFTTCIFVVLYFILYYFSYFSFLYL